MFSGCESLNAIASAQGLLFGHLPLGGSRHLANQHLAFLGLGLSLGYGGRGDVVPLCCCHITSAPLSQALPFLPCIATFEWAAVWGLWLGHVWQ